MVAKMGMAFCLGMRAADSWKFFSILLCISVADSFMITSWYWWRRYVMWIFFFFLMVRYGRPVIKYMNMGSFGDEYYSNLPLASPLSQSLYSSPQALPHSFGSNPSPLPYYSMLPPPSSPLSPLHPGPSLLDPSSDTPCQPHLPFRFPVHRLHWSRHSLSSPCPFRPSYVLQTSVGPGLLIPSALYTPPALY